MSAATALADMKERRAALARLNAENLIISGLTADFVALIDAWIAEIERPEPPATPTNQEDIAQ